MSADPEQQAADWAPSTRGPHDYHRFDAEQRALCDPEIRTRATRDANGVYPAVLLQTRAQAKLSVLSYQFTFCATCEAK